MFYKLVNKVPVKLDKLEELGDAWDVKNRRIEETFVGDVRVSTVFLCIDHSFDDNGPILFETMVFGGALNGETERSKTYDEAVTDHNLMVARVKQAINKERKS